MSKENKYVAKEREEVRKDFRDHGYQTIREFVDKFSQGMYVYMCNNWPSVDGDDLHHPEDLASNASMYAEAVFTTIQTFGAGNTNGRK
jgi:hypothetical protein